MHVSDRMTEGALSMSTCGCVVSTYLCTWPELATVPAGTWGLEYGELTLQS